MPALKWLGKKAVMGKVLESYFYGDPLEAAIRREGQKKKSCEGCAHLEAVFGKKVCSKGKRGDSRCGLYEKRENKIV